MSRQPAAPHETLHLIDPQVRTGQAASLHTLPMH